MDEDFKKRLTAALTAAANERERIRQREFADGTSFRKMLNLRESAMYFLADRRREEFHKILPWATYPYDPPANPLSLYALPVNSLRSIPDRSNDVPEFRRL